MVAMAAAVTAAFPIARTARHSFICIHARLMKWRSSNVAGAKRWLHVNIINGVLK